MNTRVGTITTTKLNLSIVIDRNIDMNIDMNIEILDTYLWGIVITYLDKYEFGRLLLVSRRICESLHPHASDYLTIQQKTVVQKILSTSCEIHAKNMQSPTKPLGIVLSNKHAIGKTVIAWTIATKLAERGIKVAILTSTIGLSRWINTYHKFRKVANLVNYHMGICNGCELPVIHLIEFKNNAPGRWDVAIIDNFMRQHIYRFVDYAADLCVIIDRLSIEEGSNYLLDPQLGKIPNIKVWARSSNVLSNTVIGCNHASDIIVKYLAKLDHDRERRNKVLILANGYIRSTKQNKCTTVAENIKIPEAVIINDPSDEKNNADKFASWTENGGILVCGADFINYRICAEKNIMCDVFIILDLGGYLSNRDAITTLRNIQYCVRGKLYLNMLLITSNDQLFKSFLCDSINHDTNICRKDYYAHKINVDSLTSMGLKIISKKTDIEAVHHFNILGTLVNFRYPEIVFNAAADPRIKARLTRKGPTQLLGGSDTYKLEFVKLCNGVFSKATNVLKKPHYRKMILQVIKYSRDNIVYYAIMTSEQCECSVPLACRKSNRCKCENMDVHIVVAGFVNIILQLTDHDFRSPRFKELASKSLQIEVLNTEADDHSAKRPAESASHPAKRQNIASD